MREQLIKYVDLLFAGAPEAGDVKQEILQNTLDRYDDLLAQGKTPQAAYSLAITGIGDVNEILAAQPEQQPTAVAVSERSVPSWRRIMKAVAIFLYIICPIPMFVLSEIGMATIGLCGTLSIVAVATALICIAGAGGRRKPSEKRQKKSTPDQALKDAIESILWAVGICIYLVISFLTGAWHITWVMFLIIPATEGLIKAVLDLREAKRHEA